jgi:hypothetical protein
MYARVATFEGDAASFDAERCDDDLVGGRERLHPAATLTVYPK